MFRLSLAAMFFAWTYLASCFVADSFYNGYVNRVRSALFRPVTALQRAFPRLSERGAAIAVFVLCLAAAAVFAGLSPASPVPGRLGGGRAFPAAVAGPGAAFAFAAGRFAVLLGEVALARLFLVWRLGRDAGSQVADAVGTAVWPLSAPRENAGALAAALCAIVAGTALSVPAVFPAAADPASVLRLSFVAAADTLMLLGNFLFAACILSWIAVIPSVAAKRPWWREALDFACDFSAAALSDFMRAVFGSAALAPGFGTFAPLLAWFVLRFLHGLVLNLIA